MKTIASPDHALHFLKADLSGGQLIRPYECPERWDYIIDALASSGFSAPQTPDALNMATVAKVHGDNYLQFLAQARSLWEAEGGRPLPGPL